MLQCCCFYYYFPYTASYKSFKFCKQMQNTAVLKSIMCTYACVYLYVCINVVLFLEEGCFILFKERVSSFSHALLCT